MKLPFPLQESEKVLLICRRHWIYLWPRLVLEALIAVLPVVALFIVLRWADALDGVAPKIAAAVSLVWLAIWGVRIFFIKYRYDNDLWTITDQRIIDSYRSSPFSLKMTSADLVDIVDTAMERSGILATMLNYGHIRCETAGSARTSRCRRYRTRRRCTPSLTRSATASAALSTKAIRSPSPRRHRPPIDGASRWLVGLNRKACPLAETIAGTSHGRIESRIHQRRHNNRLAAGPVHTFHLLLHGPAGGV